MESLVRRLEKAVAQSDSLTRRGMLRWCIRVSGTLAAVAAGVVPTMKDAVACGPCGYIACCYIMNDCCTNCCSWGCPCNYSYTWTCYDGYQQYECVECDSCCCGFAYSLSTVNGEVVRTLVSPKGKSYRS